MANFKGDTQKDIDESMRKSGVDKVVKEQAAIIRKMKLDPAKLERFLQQRASATEGKLKIEYPRDNTLEEAVARMTEAAQAEGKDKLVRSLEDRTKLVLACMRANDFNRFSNDVVKLVGKVPSLDDLNRWLALAVNIWNATPQPDRGGKTAYELSRECRHRPRRGFLKCK